MINAIKAIFIGIALVIPGLSASIFTVVVGLYDEILFSVNNFKKNKFETIKFLTPIILGCIAGILLSTKIILWICENYIHQSYSFFTGLVIGSVPIALKKIKKSKFNPLYILLTIIGFTFIYIISSVNLGYSKNYVAIDSIKTITDIFIVFFAGLISCSLMAIPGVSGSIMLMVINQYGTVYNAVGKFTDFIFYILNNDISSALECLKSIFIIIPFITGAILGFIVISKILTILLYKFESIIYYLVTGLIIGAIYTLLRSGVIPYILTLNKINMISSVLMDIVICIIGIYCSMFFDK